MSLFCFDRLKLGQGPATNSTMHPLLTRPRSISVITDQAAAALTDGNYIEQLQVSLQQASVSSLHERLQERKTSSVHPTLVSCSVLSDSSLSFLLFVYHSSTS